MTAFIPESRLSFLWKRAVIYLHQALTVTILHALRLLALKQKPGAPVHAGQGSAGDFSSGLCREGAAEPTALTALLRLSLSLGRRLLLAPEPPRREPAAPS